MISSGPRSRVRGVHARLGPAVQVGRRGLEQRASGPRHGVALVERAGLVLRHRVAERVAELLLAEHHRAPPVRGVGEDRGRRPERGDRQREHAPERRRVDGDRRPGQAQPRQLLGDQAAERVPDDHRLPVELADDRGVVVGDRPDALARERVRVRAGLLDGVRVVGPAGSQRHEPLALRDVAPSPPAAAQQPQAVHEDDRRRARGVGVVDLDLLTGCDGHRSPSGCTPPGQARAVPPVPASTGIEGWTRSGRWLG